MAQQGVSKSVGVGTKTGIKSHLLRTIAAGAEQKIVTPPVSGDFKGGTSVVIPTTQVIAAAASAQISSCVVTDDEGNILTGAFEFVEWSVDDEEKGTINNSGVLTKIGASNVVVTATVLGVTDTCTVSIT